MRKNIEKLIKSGITAYRVSKDTEMPLNTATRIFSGQTRLDNITLRNAEILNDYYLSLVDTYEVEKMQYEKDDKGNYDYSMFDAFSDYTLTIIPNLDELRVYITSEKNKLREGEGFSVSHVLRDKKGNTIIHDHLGVINYPQLENKDKVIK